MYIQKREKYFIRYFVTAFLVAISLLPNISFAGGGGGARGNIGLEGTEGFTSQKMKELQLEIKMYQIESAMHREIEQIYYEAEVTVATEAITAIIKLPVDLLTAPITLEAVALDISIRILKAYLENVLKRNLSKEEVDSIKLGILSLPPTNPIVIKTQFDIGLKMVVEDMVRKILK
jgi:hypothetical protein